MATKIIRCLECGKEKRVKNKSAKFCSDACLKLYYKRLSKINFVPLLEDYDVIDGEQTRNGYVLLALAIIRSAILERDEIFIYDLEESGMVELCCNLCNLKWETLTIAYEKYKIENDEREEETETTDIRE